MSDLAGGVMSYVRRTRIVALFALERVLEARRLSLRRKQALRLLLTFSPRSSSLGVFGPIAFSVLLGIAVDATMIVYLPVYRCYV